MILARESHVQSIIISKPTSFKVPICIIKGHNLEMKNKILITIFLNFTSNYHPNTDSPDFHLNTHPLLTKRKSTNISMHTVYKKEDNSLCLYWFSMATDDIEQIQFSIDYQIVFLLIFVIQLILLIFFMVTCSMNNWNITAWHDIKQSTFFKMIPLTL